MNPEIYSAEEISFIGALLTRFRAVITEDESLYGFTLSEFDEVVENFPNVDLYDESEIGYDDSDIVLNNLFAFTLDNNPKKILKPEEDILVKSLWNKLKNI